MAVVEPVYLDSDDSDHKVNSLRRRGKVKSIEPQIAIHAQLDRERREKKHLRREKSERPNHRGSSSSLSRSQTALKQDKPSKPSGSSRKLCNTPSDSSSKDSSTDNDSDQQSQDETDELKDELNDDDDDDQPLQLSSRSFEPEKLVQTRSSSQLLQQSLANPSNHSEQGIGNENTALILPVDGSGENKREGDSLGPPDIQQADVNVDDDADDNADADDEAQGDDDFDVNANVADDQDADADDNMSISTVSYRTDSESDGNLFYTSSEGSLHGSDSEPGLGSWTPHDQKQWQGDTSHLDEAYDGIYPVIGILRHRRHPRRGFIQYRTLWSGYPIYSTTWEPEGNFNNDKVKEYWERVGGRTADCPFDPIAWPITDSDTDEAVRRRSRRRAHEALRKKRREIRRDKIDARILERHLSEARKQQLDKESRKLEEIRRINNLSLNTTQHRTEAESKAASQRRRENIQLKKWSRNQKVPSSSTGGPSRKSSLNHSLPNISIKATGNSRQAPIVSAKTRAFELDGPPCDEDVEHLSAFRPAPSKFPSIHIPLPRPPPSLPPAPKPPPGSYKGAHKQKPKVVVLPQPAGVKSKLLRTEEPWSKIMGPLYGNSSSLYTGSSVSTSDTATAFKPSQTGGLISKLKVTLPCSPTFHPPSILKRTAQSPPPLDENMHFNASNTASQTARTLTFNRPPPATKFPSKKQKVRIEEEPRNLPRFDEPGSSANTNDYDHLQQNPDEWSGWVDFVMGQAEIGFQAVLFPSNPDSQQDITKLGLTHNQPNRLLFDKVYPMPLFRQEASSHVGMSALAYRLASSGGLAMQEGVEALNSLNVWLFENDLVILSKAPNETADESHNYYVAVFSSLYVVNEVYGLPQGFPPLVGPQLTVIPIHLKIPPANSTCFTSVIQPLHPGLVGYFDSAEKWESAKFHKEGIKRFDLAIARQAAQRYGLDLGIAERIKKSYNLLFSGSDSCPYEQKAILCFTRLLNGGLRDNFKMEKDVKLYKGSGMSINIFIRNAAVGQMIEDACKQPRFPLSHHLRRLKRLYRCRFYAFGFEASVENEKLRRIFPGSSGFITVSLSAALEELVSGSKVVPPEEGQLEQHTTTSFFLETAIPTGWEIRIHPWLKKTIKLLAPHLQEVLEQLGLLQAGEPCPIELLLELDSRLENLGGPAGLAEMEMDHVFGSPFDEPAQVPDDPLELVKKMDQEILKTMQKVQVSTVDVHRFHVMVTRNSHKSSLSEEEVAGVEPITLSSFASGELKSLVKFPGN